MNRKALNSLSIEQYAEGAGDKNNFCYLLERNLGEFGCITGSTSQKFGVWRKTTNDYAYTKKYGDSAETAYKRIKTELCKLIDAGEIDDYKTIRECIIAPLVKFKILAVYYPDRYLTIHSIDHLRHFCKQIGISFHEKDDELILQNRLKLWKSTNLNTVIQTQSLVNFVYCLYASFGRPENKEKSFNKKKHEKELNIAKNELDRFNQYSDEDKLKEAYKALNQKNEQSNLNKDKKEYERKIITRHRSVLVAKIVKLTANGFCQLCGNSAPFISSTGEPYLETHHIKPLSDGGEDSPQNAVAVCPNCHRKLHNLKLKEDIELLERIAMKH